MPKRKRDMALVASRPRTRARYAKSANPDATVLGVPPEVRILTYEFALQHSKAINLNKHPNMPGLLSVNHQIRNEAQKIFLANDFKLTFYNLDPQPKSINHWIYRSIPRLNLHYRVDGNLSWSNLKAWLRAYVTERFPGFPQLADQQNADDFKTVGHAFKLVDAIWLKGGKWPAIEAALDVFKDATDNKSGPWTWT